MLSGAHLIEPLWRPSRAGRWRPRS